VAFGFVREVGTGNVTGGSSFTISVPAAGVAAGDSILVKVNSGASTVTSVTDAAGNIYVQDAHIENGVSTAASLWRAAGVAALTSGQLITVHLAAAANAAGEASEWQGFLTPTPVDRTQTSTGASLTPTTGTTATTTQATEVAIAVLAFLRFTLTGNPAGYTALTSALGGSGTTQQTLAAAYLLLSATGTQSASWTSGNSGTYAALIVTYKADLAVHLSGAGQAQAQTRKGALTAILQLHSRVGQAGVALPLATGAGGGRAITRAASLTQITAVINYAQASGQTSTLSAALTFGAAVILNPIAFSGHSAATARSRAGALRTFWALAGHSRAGALTRRAALRVTVPLTGHSSARVTSRVSTFGIAVALSGHGTARQTARGAFLAFALSGRGSGSARTLRAELGGVLAFAGHGHGLAASLRALLSVVSLEPPVPFLPEDSYTVRVRDRLTFALLCELDTYESFDYIRRFRDAGDFTVVIGNEIAQRRLCTPIGTVFEFLRNGVQEIVCRVEYQRLTLDNTGEEGFKWELKGRDLTAEIYEYTTVPPAPALSAYDSVANLSAALAMLHYLNTNTGPPAPVEKQKPHLLPGAGFVPGSPAGDATLVQTNLATLGAPVSKDARYEPLVTVLKELAAAGGVGWRFRLDVNTGTVFFDVLGGGDRTEGTASGLIPAIFSVDRDSLATFSYENNTAAATNALYVAGPGEAATQQVLEVVDAVSVSAIGRHEDFISAPLAQSTAALSVAANAQLANTSSPFTITFEAVRAAGLAYRVDWDLGDLVTVRLDEADLHLNEQVTEVHVTAQTGAEPTVTLTVGPPPRNVLDMLLGQLKSIHGRLVAGAFTAPLLAPVPTAAQSVGALAGQAVNQPVGSVGGAASPGTVGSVPPPAVTLPGVQSTGGSANPSPVGLIDIASGTGQAAEVNSTQAAITVLATAINQLQGLAVAGSVTANDAAVVGALAGLAGAGLARTSDVQAAVTGLASAVNQLQGMAKQADVAAALLGVVNSVNALQGLAKQSDVQAAVNALRGYLDGHGTLLKEARITT
jgi:hypothetical protein